MAVARACAINQAIGELGAPEVQLPRPLAPGIQTWFAVHAALHAAVEACDRITLHPRTTVLSVSQATSRVKG